MGPPVDGWDQPRTPDWVPSALSKQHGPFVSGLPPPPARPRERMKQVVWFACGDEAAGGTAIETALMMWEYKEKTFSQEQRISTLDELQTVRLLGNAT